MSSPDKVLVIYGDWDRFFEDPNQWCLEKPKEIRIFNVRHATSVEVLDRCIQQGWFSDISAIAFCECCPGVIRVFSMLSSPLHSMSVTYKRVLDVETITRLLQSHQTTIRSVHVSIDGTTTRDGFQKILEVLQNCPLLRYLSFVSKYSIVEDHLVTIRDIVSRDAWPRLETFSLSRDHMIETVHPPLPGNRVCEILYEMERHSPDLQKLELNLETRDQETILEALVEILKWPLSWPRLRHMSLDFQLGLFLEFHEIGTSLYREQIVWYGEPRPIGDDVSRILSRREDRVRMFWLSVGKRRQYQEMDPMIRLIFQLPEDLFLELKTMFV